jgi:hypothetical protein
MLDMADVNTSMNNERAESIKQHLNENRNLYGDPRPSTYVVQPKTPKVYRDISSAQPPEQYLTVAKPDKPKAIEQVKREALQHLQDTLNDLKTAREEFSGVCINSLV